jgi:hypothetical protein
MKKRFIYLCFVISYGGIAAFSQSNTDNSNFWPVHRDTQAMFRISYPDDWVVTPPKGRNARFSVYPKDGAGNCNVVVVYKPELLNMTQADLNKEIAQLPQDAAGWAEYAGLPASNVRVLESRIGHILDIPALVGVLETKLENLQGKYTRYHMVAFFLKPGEMWSVNCGATSSNANEARDRFNILRHTFNKMLGSFMFLQ